MARRWRSTSISAIASQPPASIIATSNQDPARSWIWTNHRRVIPLDNSPAGPSDGQEGTARHCTVRNTRVHRGYRQTGRPRSTRPSIGPSSSEFLNPSQV